MARRKFCGHLVPVPRGKVTEPDHSPRVEPTGWFQKVGDTCIGPFTQAELAQMISSGALEENDLLRIGHEGDWTPASQVGDLVEVWSTVGPVRNGVSERGLSKAKPSRIAQAKQACSRWFGDVFENVMFTLELAFVPKHYFEVPPPKEGFGLCSDDECPCGTPGEQIEQGKGYLYISRKAVEFRSRCLNWEEFQRLIGQVQYGTRKDFAEKVLGARFAIDAPVSQIEDFIANSFGGKDKVFLEAFMKQELELVRRVSPILVCISGAKRRKLDLTVAAADARRWWKTGKVPLRPTPMGKWR